MLSEGQEPGNQAHDARHMNGEQPAQQISSTGQPEQQIPFAPLPVDEDALQLDMLHEEPAALDMSAHRGLNSSQPLIANDPHQPASQPASAAQPVQPVRSILSERLWQYFSVILVPLLFGGVTCLIVLPLIATGHASLPAIGLWPVVLFILLIAVAQGVALYYSGANTGLWAVSNLAALFLFLLVATFAVFGLLSGFVLFLILLLISIALFRFYIKPVPEGYVNIIYAFGKYSRTLYPGFNVLLPWEKVVHELSTIETQWVCPPQRVQMSRTEDVVLRATIGYQLLPEEEYLAVTQVKQWEESLHELFIATLQTAITMVSPNDLIAWQHGLHTQGADLSDSPESMARWEQINRYLFQHVQDRAISWGVQIKSVSIHDILLTPHNAPVVEEIVAQVQQSQTPPAQPSDAARPLGTDATAPSSASRPRPAVTLPDTLKKEDLERVLVSAYKQVQDGRIADPETIRGIADQFAAIAQDPEKSKLVSFDAERAALTLYARASRYEQAYAASNPYSDTTKSDWSVRRSNDENMMAGG